jgi:calcineurin-like phosphoesterase family protein
LGTKAFKEIGFKDVFKRLELGKFVLSHRPLPLEELKENQINLHGHIHNKKIIKSSAPQHLNLSCEVINYTPLWLDITI